MVEEANDSKMADTVDNFGPSRSETKEVKRNESSDEGSCEHEENEFKMSVTVSKDWTGALKSQNDPDYDCAAVLRKIVSDAKKQKLCINLSEETWRLDGCFSCIKEIRKALQAEIRGKQRDQKERSDEFSVDLENDQMARQKYDGMKRTDLSGNKPEALMDSPTLGDVDRELRRKDDIVSDARSREKEENLKYLQLKEENGSMLKNGDEKLNNKRHRQLVKNSSEDKISPNDGKGIRNIGDTGGGRQLKTEDSSRNGKYSENEKQKSTGQLYPALPTPSENSDIQKDLAKPSHGAYKSSQNESRGVTTSDNSERRRELKKDEAPNDVRHSDSQKHQWNDPRMPTSKNVKDSANFTKPSNTSSPQESKTNDQKEQDRIYALRFLPSVFIDEDMLNYLDRCRHVELYCIAKKCNVFERCKAEQGHKFTFEAKPEYGTDSVTADLRALINRTPISHCNTDLPEEVDPETLRSLVMTMDEFKDVYASFMSIHRTRVVQIVGPYKEMEKARKALTDVIASNRSTSHGLNPTADKRSGFNVQKSTTPPHNNPIAGVPLYSTIAAINVGQPRTSIFTILNQTHNSLMLSASNSLTIEVKFDELTKVQDVDAVVSCINHQLDPDGPLSREIVRAAGPNVRKELDAHKFYLKFLHTGNLAGTSAGYLKGVKSIIHVVRPQLVEFPSNDQRSRDILRQVFANCFHYTNDKLIMKSICLPAIGFSLYGGEMVVDCFLDAVDMFVATVANPSAPTQHHPQHLNLIQLVTNDYSCIGKLIHCITRRVRVGLWQVSEV